MTILEIAIENGINKVCINGEVILEQCKDMIVPSVLDKISQSRVDQAEKAMEVYKKENDMFKRFLEKYHIDMKRVIKETEDEGNV